MCGFGDKDRRLICPPPCVKLRIQYSETGEELTSIKDIDISQFTVVAELFSVDEQENLSVIEPDQPITFTSSISTPLNLKGTTRYGQQQGQSQHSIISGLQTPIRNLTGACVATAFKLYDLDDDIGIWFIFHDLSVRTEGNFRLKFSFTCLEPNPLLHSGVPMLCFAFSQPFRSYSAKKFPGVVETTELSRCFALQGIRIAIRRSNKGFSEKSRDAGNKNNSNTELVLSDK